MTWPTLNYLTRLFLFLFLLGGCALSSQQAVCRHDAIYAALTWTDLTKLPVAIAVGFASGGGRHAQAFTLAGEEDIVWLEVVNGIVGPGKKDDFFPYVSMTVKEFREKFIKVVDYKGKTVLLSLD